VTVDSRRQFARTVRRDDIDLGLACALLAVEARPDTDVGGQLARLDALAEATRPLVAVHAGPGAPPMNGPFPIRPWPGGNPVSPSAAGRGGTDLRAVAGAFEESLGRRAGFAGRAADYDDLRSSLLPEVLLRRRGLPILLSVVWLAVARRLGVRAYPIGLPGHVIVAIGTPGDHVLVDPYDGGKIITVHEVAEKTRSAGTPFTRSLLAPLAPVDLVMRVLTNIRVLAARTDEQRTRLWAVELSLLLPHHPAGLRRERGELLVRRGDFPGGAADLEAFAAAVEPVEPAAAAAARRAAHTARARLN
jgi:regulator of sirC expression with transglutaminase-like and TPR domain